MGETDVEGNHFKMGVDDWDIIGQCTTSLMTVTEFPVSSVHACVQYVRQNIREDMEDRWVTNLSEDRKRFYLVSSLLDPHTKMLSFCDNKYFPSSWKDDAVGYLSIDLKSFYLQRTFGEVQDSDGQVKHRSDLDELLGMSTTSMDFDVVSVEG